jgi:ligand-binding SRPBCC domain-containing protein
MYILIKAQKLPLKLEEAWTFFSTPTNLKLLTPESLNMEITSHDENKGMYPGQIISYNIHPFMNIPLEWVTEITHVEEPNYFIDEQRFGPYKFWHHEHRLKAIPNGVEMVDTIYYKLPFGPLGKVLHALKVKRDLEDIFTYRYAKLEKLFGPYIEPKKS